MDKGEGPNEIEINPEVDFADEEECEHNDLPQVESPQVSDIMQFPEPSTSTNNQNHNKKMKSE